MEKTKTNNLGKKRRLFGEGSMGKTQQTLETHAKNNMEDSWLVVFLLDFKVFFWVFQVAGP